MAANGNSGNGNTGTATSASQAQSQAAAGNAAASNAANSGNSSTGSGNTSNTSGNTGSTTGSTSTNTSAGATNSAGLMGSLIGFGNAVAKGEVGNGGGGSGTGNKTYSEMSKELGFSEAETAKNDKIQSIIANIFTNAEDARNSLPAEQVAAGDRAYTKARAEGKTEAEAQYAARDVMRGMITDGASVQGLKKSYTIGAFKAKNTGPTYNPANTAMSNVNPTIAAGSSNIGPSNATAANNAPGGNLGGETGGIAGSTETAAPSVSDAANTGVTYRGGTVSTPSGTSVTDSGTGGSVSSGVNAPSRDASSIGLGVYNTDRANYDQDNWNRGMESESSSLVSDEECKAFAKRAFIEDSEPFKVVRTTILKKC